MDLIHLVYKLKTMGTTVKKTISLVSLCTTLLFSFAQAKTKIQLELEDIQFRQNRLLHAHLKEENPDDRESLEFRIFSLRDEYQSLLSQHPDNVLVLITYGLFLARLDEREDSLKLLLKADSIEPEHAQVKNQLGNFMIEEASYQLALSYYLDAVRLAPMEPLYHYQLGNLLFYFRKEFVRDEIFTLEHLNKQMFEAFKNAAKFAPDNMAYQYRLAEAYYDMPEADMNLALEEWKRIEGQTDSPRDKQIVQLHQANVHLILGNMDVASLILEKVSDPYLASNKEKLLDQIHGTEPGSE